MRFSGTVHGSARIRIADDQILAGVAVKMREDFLHAERIDDTESPATGVKKNHNTVELIE